MNRSRAFASALALLLLMSANRPAMAAWPHEPNNGNVALCAATGNQAGSTAISDGAGGAIVSWYDIRNGTNYDIYAQRINAAGVPLWTANGVALCTAANDQFSPALVSDGAGGAIVTWADNRSGNYDIYAQRISAAGAPQWTANGVVLCAAANEQPVSLITSDGAGGAIVTWYDLRGGVNYDLYAQRVNPAGAPLWTANGVAVCTAANNQINPMIDSDGSGGAVVTWSDVRNGANYDIYAQRINPAGTPLWTANGVALCTATGDQTIPMIASDGAAGAIVTWTDSRVGAATDIYAQRINAAGFPQWAADGLAVCTAANGQSSPTIAVDGAGGAIVVWTDARGGATGDIYAQRIVSSGLLQWTANGVALCTAAGNQTVPVIAADGAGGAIAVWCDVRGGQSNDIYAQRVSSTGAPSWTANGVALCTAVNNQTNPSIVSDGAGSAVVAWNDVRNALHTDIYAQRVEAFGKLGNPEPAIASVLDIPNDQGGRVRLAWDASWLDRENDPDLAAYDIFHSVPPNLAQEAIARGESRALHAGEVPAAGVHAYLFTGFSAQQYAWEYVSTVNAQHFIATYGSTQATTSDSVAGWNPTTSFMVVGRNGSGSKYWLSAPAAGYSVDNLPPAAPAPFTGQYAAGSTSLHWDRNTETDLAGYRLYRGSSVGFVPGPGNLVGALADTGFVDAAGGTYVYKLTAVDSHGNESPVATLIPSGTVDVVGGPAAAFFLAAIAPNPSSRAAASTLRFGLSRDGRADLDVLDAAGRRVRTLLRGVLPAGEHTVRWDGRLESGDRAAAGLYFVRLQAQGQRAIRRLALIE